MPSSRIDRAVTLKVVQPARRLFGNSDLRRIPVLMYHGINNVTRNRHPYFETNTSPAVFARQMQQLREHGYRSVTLDAAISAIDSGRCDEKSVVITFDDGFRDFYTHAMPILQENHFSATMFIVSGFIGSRPICFDDREVMTWGEVREIMSCGIEIGSHTVSHFQLRNLHPRSVESEIKYSKNVIEDRLGVSVVAFSYPYAFPEQDSTFRGQLQHYLRSSGYDYGVTTILGSANQRSDRYFLPRLPVNEHDDARLFQAKLEGDYDWLHAPQLMHKFIRGHGKVGTLLSQEQGYHSSSAGDL